MSSKLSIEKLKANLAKGEYSRSKVACMLHQMEAAGDPSKNPKYTLCKEWLSGTIREAVLGTSSGGITEDSIDLKVARKILQLKKSADSRGKDFNLTLSDVKSLLIRKTCYFTGVRFQEEGREVRSIDRLDSTKGYVKGNVVACTVWANQMKEQMYEAPDAKIKLMKKLIKKVDSLGL